MQTGDGRMEKTGNGNRPLASTRLDRQTVVPMSFQWPTKRPFMRKEGLSKGIISCGCFSSLARSERTCPFGKKRLVDMENCCVKNKWVMDRELLTGSDDM